MANPTRQEQISKIHPDDIERLYRKGYMTAKQRNDLMREKADVTLTQTLEQEGYLGAILKQSVKNLQDGWDNLKESALREPSGSVRTELYYVGLAMWGQIQMLTSVMNAVGEVTGKVAEQQALRAGASPGLAKTIGFAVDVGTGFVPIGAASRSFVRGVQSGEASKLVKKVSEKLTKPAQAAEKQQVAAKVIASGLEADGVKGAEKILTPTEILSPKGATEAVDAEGARIIRETEEAIAKSKTPSVAEQFAADLKKYQDEIASLTETQTHEMTAKMADKLGLTIDDLRNIKPGQALNERELLAYLKALESPIHQATALAERAVKEGTEDAANAFAKHMSELFSYAPKFRGAEVTAGRSVEILKESPPMKAITNMLAGWDAEKAAKGDFVGAAQTMAEDWLALMTEAPEKAPGVAAVGASLWERFRDKGWPMMREAYINLLLARPVTAVRNFLGNSIAGATSVSERLAGGIFSADKAHGLVGSEAFALSKGMALAIGDGLKAWANAFKKIGPADANKFDFVPGEIPGTIGRIIRLPGDNLRGMDNFFKTLFRRGSYYSQAIREGAQKGLEKDDLANFVARRVNNPTEAMLKEAEEFATTQTFQNELGTMAKRFQSNLQSGPLALYFPFMKTPINLMKYAWNRTPGLQLISKSLYDDIKAGGVKADMAIGRLTMANLMGMFLFEMAKDGLITGSGPVDPNINRVWRVSNEPYSVKTKDGWMPISNAEPGSTVLGMVADFTQVVNQLDQPTAEQGAMAIAFTLMKDMADKTYWQTMGDLLDLGSAIGRGSSPGKTPMQVLASPLINVATGGPLGSGIARAMDPIKRETRGILDNITSKIPGYSKTVPPDRDPYGDPILYPQAIGGSWLGMVSPLILKPLEEDRVKKEGNRLQVKVPDFPWAIGGKMNDDFDIRAPYPEDSLPVELSPQERDQWQVMYRNLLRHQKYGIEAVLLNKPEYQNAPRALQREMFTDFLSQSRSTARDALMVKEPTIGVRVLENKAKHVLPMLTESQRAEVEPQLQQSISLFDSLSAQERMNLLRWGIVGEETEAKE